MDSFATVLRGRSEFRDLVVVSVLKDDSKSRLAKMVATRQMPVLQDTPETNFREVFGASGARAFFVFDRRGCLVQFDFSVSPDQPGQLDQLLDPLRRAVG